ncbi:response regulator [Robertkochia sediminum]|uniref:response regulator n=1 Tax=Robertkochia sediminum TaxID=2785326 RepID=UPI00193495B3|nr:response regulator [Robertkochia sediminum]MBL7473506.1 response regulator [Robertkochia sediminum]
MPDKKLILIAEEDKMQATLLAFRLRRKGFRVEMVHHGEGAMRYLKEYHPNLIICGLELPGLHAFDLLKIARNRFRESLPVVVLTNNSENRLHPRLFEAGATECMTKPVDPAAFVEMVELELNQFTAL